MAQWWFALGIAAGYEEIEKAALLEYPISKRKMYNYEGYYYSTKTPAIKDSVFTHQWFSKETQGF